MKILFVSQWCYPEPDSRIFIMAKELALIGHNVQILTGFPNYPGGEVYEGYSRRIYKRETLEGIDVLRVWLYPSHNRSSLKRALNYLSYAISASILGLFITKKADIIYVYHPPSTTFIPAFILKVIYKCKLVYDIQDLWPDSVSATGMVNASPIVKILKWFQRYIYKKANAITVISNGFKEKLIERKVPKEKIHVIPNWSIPINIKATNNNLFSSINDNKFIVLFAGNIGQAQGLNTIIDAAKLLSAKNIHDIEFVLLGSGSAKANLIEYKESQNVENVTFLDRVSPEEIGNYLIQADVLLIHLIDNPLFRITIPSKTQSYLMVGKPILAGVEGDAAAIINESKAGMVFKPEDASDLINKLLLLFSLTNQELEQLGRNGKQYYDSNMSINIGVKKFNSLFLELNNSI